MIELEQSLRTDCKMDKFGIVNKNEQHHHKRRVEKMH